MQVRTFYTGAGGGGGRQRTSSLPVRVKGGGETDGAGGRATGVRGYTPVTIKRAPTDNFRSRLLEL